LVDALAKFSGVVVVCVHLAGVDPLPDADDGVFEEKGRFVAEKSFGFFHAE